MGKVLVINNADFSANALKQISITNGCYIDVEVAGNFHISETLPLITGKGYYTVGQVATVTASSNSSFSFVRWSDGSTNPVKTISVTNEDTITLTTVYDFTYVANDFTWGNGGITHAGTSSGSLNLAASTINKLIHAEDCVLKIADEYADDYRISAYGYFSTVPKLDAGYAASNGTYINLGNDPSAWLRTLSLESGKYYQIAISNVNNVSFTSDLSACANILLIGGSYELTTLKR